ncbi:MAG: hypothetical protein ACREAC_08245 [Blastocatellia bacterium]
MSGDQVLHGRRPPALCARAGPGHRCPNIATSKTLRTAQLAGQFSTTNVEEEDDDYAL